ncbi:hypothetical protein GH714_031547 [Hevea brasiliensis]|uniref:SCP domain-containing protein n=1 Tax=Hevea brasiliensis TaxID=3981 RepID=A0A6A6L636_HEVBR|nr:hypothetical protein GH714_031547 [Hevea brasiliensis]
MDPALLLLPLLVALSIFQGAAQPSSPIPSPMPTAARDFLEAHNQARAAVGVGPLKWSEMLANATSRLVRYQRNKMGCQFANLSNSVYGGNQLWASGMAVTPRMVVDHWVEEKIYYNHTDNSCVPNHQCGVYTQGRAHIREAVCSFRLLCEMGSRDLNANEI